jgi:hypothetical protein
MVVFARAAVPLGAVFGDASDADTGDAASAVSSPGAAGPDESSLSGAPPLLAPVRLTECAVAGVAGRWVSTTTYRLDPPTAGWPTDLHCSLEIDMGVTTVSGAPLADDTQFVYPFETASLQMVVDAVESPALAAATGGAYRSLVQLRTDGSSNNNNKNNNNNGNNNNENNNNNNNNNAVRRWMHEIADDAVIALRFSGYVIDRDLVASALVIVPDDGKTHAGDAAARARHAVITAPSTSSSSSSSSFSSSSASASSSSSDQSPARQQQHRHVGKGVAVELVSRSPDNQPLGSTAAPPLSPQAYAALGCDRSGIVCVRPVVPLVRGERYSIVLPPGSRYHHEAGLVVRPPTAPLTGLTPFEFHFSDFGRSADAQLRVPIPVSRKRVDLVLPRGLPGIDSDKTGNINTKVWSALKSVFTLVDMGAAVVPDPSTARGNIAVSIAAAETSGSPVNITVTRTQALNIVRIHIPTLQPGRHYLLSVAASADVTDAAGEPLRAGSAVLAAQPYSAGMVTTRFPVCFDPENDPALSPSLALSPSSSSSSLSPSDAAGILARAVGGLHPSSPHLSARDTTAYRRPHFMQSVAPFFWTVLSRGQPLLASKCSARDADAGVKDSCAKLQTAKAHASRQLRAAVGATVDLVRVSMRTVQTRAAAGKGPALAAVVYARERAVHVRAPQLTELRVHNVNLTKLAIGGKGAHELAYFEQVEDVATYSEPLRTTISVSSQSVAAIQFDSLSTLVVVRFSDCRFDLI